MNEIINNKEDLPSFVRVEISNCIKPNYDDNSDEISEQDDFGKNIIDTNKEISEMTENLNQINIEKTKVLVF